MRLFVDSADIDEIKEMYRREVVSGVTTNPSLIRKAMEKHGIDDMKAYIGQILETVGFEDSISLEVVGTEYKDMASEGACLIDELGADNIAVKVPVNPRMGNETYLAFDGVKTINLLNSMGINTNATLVMRPEQALLAAVAGAAFVSPFAGRVDDFLREQTGKKFDKGDYYPKDGTGENYRGIASGVHLVKRCVQFLNHYGYSTEVIAASTRNRRQLFECAEAGAHIATVPFSVLETLGDEDIEKLGSEPVVESDNCPELEAMLEHPKTEEGMKKFSEDVQPEYEEIFSEKGEYLI